MSPTSNSKDFPKMNPGKALFLYSDATGTGKVLKNIEKVKARLAAAFEILEPKKIASIEEGCALAKEACGEYDYLIVAGGDGTFHHIVNAIAREERQPILGYINAGTICDIGVNFGIKGSYKRALRILEDGAITSFDLGEINGTFFTYVAAVGSYADIPYVTPRKYKKRLGRLAYYFVAVKEAFVPKKIPVHVVCDGKAYDLKVPFLLLLSGKRVGGFPVNRLSSAIDDGKMELFLTKPGLFNGLIHYLFFKTRTLSLTGSEFEISVQYPFPWCLDGEAGPVGDVRITVHPRKMRIFCSRRLAGKPKS